MYRDHQPAIARWARAKPEHLARVYQFVVASARVKFFNVPAVIEEADRGDPGALFSWKAEAWAYARDHAFETWLHCEDISNLSVNRFERGMYLVRYLACLPGLDITKAGFIAQLAYGCAGCIDTVNLQRLPIADTDKTALRKGSRRMRMKRQITARKRLDLARWYVSVCEHHGGPSILWDEWCAAMADRYPSQFPTADAASAFHWTCLWSGHGLTQAHKGQMNLVPAT